MKAIVRERKTTWKKTYPYFDDVMCRFIGKEIEVEFNQLLGVYISVGVRHRWRPEWVINEQNGGEGL